MGAPAIREIIRCLGSGQRFCGANSRSAHGALVGHSGGESKMIKHCVSGLFLDHSLLGLGTLCQDALVRLSGGSPSTEYELPYHRALPAICKIYLTEQLSKKPQTARGRGVGGWLGRERGRTPLRMSCVTVRVERWQTEAYVYSRGKHQKK